MTSNICCSTCHYKVDIVEGSNTCPQCGLTFQNQQGVIDFIPDSDFYWGEIDENHMKTVNEMAEREGWFSAIRQYFTDRPEFVKYIVDPARLGWLFHCYDEENNEACLDIGSGWGPLSFGLSRFYKTVYSVDGVYERLRFQAIRAESDNISNIRLLRSTLLKLPLSDNTVDMVALNGVLEWIGLSDLEQEPDELQAAFLCEIRRVLKPNGRVYLGIENRFSVLYFLGAKDHGGTRFTSLMPRWLASKVVTNIERRKGQQGVDAHVFSGIESGYRTYTYSARGYKKMLQKAGFPVISTNWAWSGYSFPRMSGPTDGISIRYVLNHLRDLTDKTWLHLLLNLMSYIPNQILGWLIRIFSPYFLIIAGTEPARKTVQEIACQSKPEAKSFVRLTMGSNINVKTTFLLLDHNEVVKSIRVTEQKLESSSSFIYSESDGISGSVLQPHNQNDVSLAANWLAQYHQETTAGNWNGEELAAEIYSLSNTVQQLSEDQELHSNVERFCNQYIESLNSIQLPIVAEHGDYTPPNLIVTPRGKLNVIDWEFAREMGNPLLDVGAFSLSMLRRSARNGIFSTSKRSTDPSTWFTQEYIQARPIPYALAPTYYLLRIVKRISESANQSPEMYIGLSTWLPLLKPSLQYSFDLTAKGY